MFIKKIFPEEELKKVLILHRTWLISGGIEGKRAVIENKDMRHRDLSCINLSHAILTGNDMRHTDLSSINLSHAILTGNDMRHTDLSSINLSHAKLVGNDMRWIDMSYADLRYAKLTGNDMTSTDMRYTCIEGCLIPMACPSDGAFVGWKKARHCGEEVLVKLLIPEDAKRSSATGRKCRCDKAKVIEILTMKGNIEVEFAVSEYDSSFIYKKGEVVCEPNFCEDRFNECAEGIHFFIDRKEAEFYSL